MKEPSTPKVILWDFDGVIINSMPTREQGFRRVLENFGPEVVEKFINFHRQNDGRSRYLKFKHLYENLLGETADVDKIKSLADQFSVIMKEILVDKNLLIKDSLDFITKHYQEITMYIVSGSDQEELRHLCEQLGIAEYFKGIYGSPTPKPELIKNLIAENNYDTNEIVLIGDSPNDHDAAQQMGIGFWGYNNEALIPVADAYVPVLSNLIL